MSASANTARVSCGLHQLIRGVSLIVNFLDARKVDNVLFVKCRGNLVFCMSGSVAGVGRRVLRPRAGGPSGLLGQRVSCLHSYWWLAYIQPHRRAPIG